MIRNLYPISVPDTDQVLLLEIRNRAYAGNVAAQYLYGVLQSEGLGVEKDRSRGRFWMRLASEVWHGEKVRNLYAER